MSLFQFRPTANLLPRGFGGHGFKCFSTVDGSQILEGLDGVTVHAIAFSHDSKTLAVNGAKKKSRWRVYLWDVTSGEPIGEVPHGTYDPNQLRFTADGAKLLISERMPHGANPAVDTKVWNLRSDQLEKVISHPCLIRRDGVVLDSATVLREASRNEVRRVNVLENGRVLHLSNGYKQELWDVASGTLLECVSFDAEEVTGRNYDIKLIDPRTGVTRFFNDAERYGLLWYSRNRSVTSRDGRYVVTGTPHYPNRLVLKDGATGQTISRFTEAAQWTTIDFSPDGEILAAVDYGGPLRVWDLQENSEKWSFQLESTAKYGGRGNPVAFSPDGKTLAAESSDHVVLLDANSGTPGLKFGPHSVLESIAFSPDGQQLATCGRDGTVKLWNVKDGRLARVIRIGPALGQITEVQFAPDGRHLITTNGNGTAYILRLKELGKERPSVDASKPDARGAAPWQPGPREDVLPGLVSLPAELPNANRWQIETIRPRGRIHCLAWSPDDRLIACGTAEGCVRVYDSETLELARLLPGHTRDVRSVAWSPDGKKLVSAGTDATIRLWSSDGSPDGVLKGHANQVNCVAWSPDGKRLLSGSYDQTVRLWSADGKAIRVLKDHQGDVRSVDWKPDGTAFASASMDGTVRIWDADGVIQQVIEDLAESVQWSPDGQQLALGSAKSVRFWRPDVPLQTVVEKHARFTRIAWSPAGDQLAAGDYGAIVNVWNLDGKQVHRLTGHGHHVYSAKWSHDGRWLASVGCDCSLRIWDRNGQPGRAIVGTPPLISNVGWSPDGELLAYGTEDGTVGLLRSDGRVSQRCDGYKVVVPPFFQTVYVHSLSWSLDSQKFATTAAYQTVKIWKRDGSAGPVLADNGGYVSVGWCPTGGKLALGSPGSGIRIWNLAESTVEDRIPASGGRDGQFLDFCWSPDGIQLATVRRNRKIHVWNVDGSPQNELSIKGARVAWSPNGQTLASWGGHDFVSLSTPDGLNRPPLKEQGFAGPAAWSPDGKHLAVGRFDGGVRIWSVTAVQGPLLHGTMDQIIALSWSAERDQIAASDTCRHIRVWDAATAESNWSAVVLNDGTTVTFGPAGQLLHGDAELVEEEFVYLIETETGALEVLKPSEFAERIGVSSQTERRLLQTSKFDRSPKEIRSWPQ